MSELLKEIKHIIKLGEKEYEIPEINLNTLTKIEDEFGCGLGGLQEQFNQKQATTLRTLAWVMLKGKYPELTKEDIGNNVNLQNTQVLIEKLFAVLKESLEG
jgi:hypothetical protein